jgi:HD-GYP domain-containing protein (c-di-GMP phosphodiesterase class II)
MKSATRYSIAVALVALLVLVGVGAFLINAYIGQERQRDLLHWESRLGLVADAKADAVYRLLLNDRRNLQETAGNASLRFYLWQVIEARGAQAAGTEPGALGYLRNLLLASAERYGYLADGGARVPANIAQPRSAGIAILDAALDTVVVTPGLIDVRATYSAVAQRALSRAQGHAVELVRDALDRPVIVTAVTIGTVTGTEPAGSGKPLGIVLGVRSAEEEFFPLLTRGPAFAEDNESLLLDLRADTVALLSPTRDGSPGLRRTLPFERKDLAEVAAVTSPGRFVALDNYLGRPVLQVSRPIRGTNWVLVQQVDAAAAMSLADERRRFLLTALSLLLFAIVAVAVAAWRHGSSVRARHQAEELADKAARLQKQTDLLHTITDNLDALTLLVSRDHTILFSNRAAAELAGSGIATMIGRPLRDFVPAIVFREIEEGMSRMRGQAIVYRQLQWPAADAPRSFHASFIPVERIGAEQQPTLLVLGDVTQLEQVHRRNTELLRGLVLTLVSAVDRHDPFAANHARRMTEVVDALARELGFSDQERSTLDLAASLANIGKILIPVEVLAKSAPLTVEEQELLQKHVDYGLELLRGLQFEGPVIDIIAQKQERPDGGGYPHGLSGDRITLAGQVLAVANAFVALLSARAWRRGLSVKDALDELMRGAGTQFDRRVIAALFHVAENRRDWSQWE